MNQHDHDGDESWSSDDSWDESLEDDSWDEEPTLPCPACGVEIHEESVRCPQCGDYIDWSRSSPVQAPWSSFYRWTAAILVFAFLLPFLVMIYQLLSQTRR
jgi:endogenous inhibitor of DNA gyrase (YacG/DUF329 family)